MAVVGDLTQLLLDLNDAIDHLSTRQAADEQEIATLQAQIAAGSGSVVTQAELDTTVAGLQTINDRLRVLGNAPPPPSP